MTELEILKRKIVLKKQALSLFIKEIEDLEEHLARGAQKDLDQIVLLAGYNPA